MNEVLVESQIDSDGEEINVDGIIKSHEQSSVESELNIVQDQKSAPLSPDIGDYVSDPEKYELEYENSGNIFRIAEDGSIDLERNGQSMTELMESIASDDRTSDCRSAFSDAFYDGVGVITSESDTEYFVMLIVRDNEAEASWITYKGFKEEEKDELKEKHDEELEEQPEFKIALKSEAVVMLEAISGEIAPAENAIHATASVLTFETFSDFNQFMKAGNLKENVENSDVPNSVDNVVSTPANLHGSAVVELSNDTQSEIPPEAAGPEMPMALEDVDSRDLLSVRESFELIDHTISASDEVVGAPIEDVHLNTAPISSLLIEQAPAVEETPNQAIESVIDQQPKSFVEEFEELPPVALDAVPITESSAQRLAEADEPVITTPAAISQERPEHFAAIEELEEISSLVQEPAAVIEREEKTDSAIGASPVKLSVEQSIGELTDSPIEVIEDARLPAIDTSKTPEENIAGTAVFSIEHINDASTIEVSAHVQSSELPPGPSKPHGGGPAIERESPDIRAGQEKEIEPLLFESTPDAPITPSQFEIVNTISLIETGIGIRPEKVAEIIPIEIKVTDENKVVEKIALLPDSVEKPIQQQEQATISIDNSEDSSSNTSSAVSKSSSEVQSQIFAETGIRMVRNNPSYTYEIARPRRGANSLQDLTKIDNDTQLSQPAMQLAKAA